MEFWIIVLLFFVAVVGIAAAQASSLSDRKKAMTEKLESFPDFTPTQNIMGDNGDTGLAIDEGRKKIILIKNGTGGVDLKLISYGDLLSSEIFVDGETITKTSRGSQLGGALIGGLTLGGVGAVIGGLSGKTTSSEKIKRVDLRITINDTKNPVHDINLPAHNFIKEDNGEIVYKSAIDQARHWHGLMTVLIKMADNEDTREKSVESLAQAKSGSKASMADELLKLSSLRDKGVLTDEEFFIQKRKLLS